MKDNDFEVDPAATALPPPQEQPAKAAPASAPTPAPALAATADEDEDAGEDLSTPCGGKHGMDLFHKDKDGNKVFNPGASQRPVTLSANDLADTFKAQSNAAREYKLLELCRTEPFVAELMAEVTELRKQVAKFAPKKK